MDLASIDATDERWRAIADLPALMLDGRSVVVKGSDERPGVVHWQAMTAGETAKLGWWTADGPFPGPVLAWLDLSTSVAEASLGSPGIDQTDFWYWLDRSEQEAAHALQAESSKAAKAHLELSRLQIERAERCRGGRPDPGCPDE